MRETDRQTDGQREREKAGHSDKQKQKKIAMGKETKGIRNPKISERNRGTEKRATNCTGLLPSSLI